MNEIKYDCNASDKSTRGLIRKLFDVDLETLHPEIMARALRDGKVTVRSVSYDSGLAGSIVRDVSTLFHMTDPFEVFVRGKSIGAYIDFGQANAVFCQAISKEWSKDFSEKF